MRSAKFHVMVFKASMLHWQGVYLPNMRSVSRSARFGVMVFKASMLNLGGRSARQICQIRDLPSLV